MDVYELKHVTRKTYNGILWGNLLWFEEFVNSKYV